MCREVVGASMSVSVCVSELLKRVDDSSEDVRLEALKSLSTWFSSLGKNYDPHSCRPHLEFLFQQLLLYMDDPDAKVQDSVLGKGARIQTAAILHFCCNNLTFWLELWLMTVIFVSTLLWCKINLFLLHKEVIQAHVNGVAFIYGPLHWSPCSSLQRASLILHFYTLSITRSSATGLPPARSWAVNTFP